MGSFIECMGKLRSGRSDLPKVKQSPQGGYSKARIGSGFLLTSSETCRAVFI